MPAHNQLLADIKPGKKKATLILSDGRKIELSNKDTTLNSNIEGIKIHIDSMGIKYISDIKKLDKTEISKSTQLKSQVEMN